MAASSPGNDLVKNCRVHPTHWLISTHRSEAFSRGMRFRTDMLFNGSICGAQRDKNGDPDFGAPCAFDAVREDLARRPLRGVPDGRPFLEARRDLARRR